MSDTVTTPDTSPLTLTPAELDTIIAGEPAKPETPPEEPKFTEASPDKLPKELHDTYKSMQGDYTRKTQELAQQRRELAEQRERLEAAKAASSDQTLAELQRLKTELEELKVSKVQAPVNQEELEPWQVELQKKDERIAMLERRQDQAELQKDIERADKIFETLKAEDEVFAGYEKEILATIKANPKLHQAIRKDPEGSFDRMYGMLMRRDRKNLEEQVRKTERERVLVEIKERAQKATSSRTSLSGGSSVTQPVGSVSLEEAYEAAKRQHAVA